MTDTWRTLKAWPELILEQLADAGVARVILNRPDKRNCLNETLVAAWFEALDIVRADREIKVVITKGAGICFSSGLDLHFLRKVSEEPRDWDRPTPTVQMAEALRGFPRIVIAQVHGYCLGGGTVYGYLTDLTVASDDAYFQMPLPQGFGLPGAQTLVEPWALMNWKRAYEYLYLSPTLSAEQAQEWGLVNRVVPRADLEATVEETAATIAQMPLTTILTIKAGVKRAWETMGMRVHLQSTADFTTIASAATDVREFMATRKGLLPRQVAERQAQATREGDSGTPDPVGS
jgi:enoyl-CoA hydratase